MDDRLNRQRLIEGWNQDALDKAKIAVIGDNDLLASSYVMSAAALGINHIVVVAPTLDKNLMAVAQGVNEKANLIGIQGNYVHPSMEKLIAGCNLVVDLSSFSLANKLLIQRAYEQQIPVIRAALAEDKGQVGFNIFSYMRGREWACLDEVISPNALPTEHFDDPVLDLITSGIALEETKNVLMGQKVSEEVIKYRRDKIKKYDTKKKLFVTGAGALGNFAALALAYSGFKDITIIDPDSAELTNLNRQVLLFGGVGKPKAETLAERINAFFGTKAKPIVEYLREGTDLTAFDAVFDCVDNFETRIVQSELCKDKRVLVSGGTNVDAGQAVIYVPGKTVQTPAEFLGLYDIVKERKKAEYVRERAACTYRPNPSVIMTNQIIAAFMVEQYRRMLVGQEVGNVFYDSKSDSKIGG